jgi:hypothetical protein
MTRRQFLQHCTTSAAALGLRHIDLARVTQGMGKKRLCDWLGHRYSLQTLHGAKGSTLPQNCGLPKVPYDDET